MKTNLVDKLTKAAKNLGRQIDKHSPEILIGCGIVGFVSTCVLVAKESPVAKDKLDELHEELAEIDEELTKPQIIFKEIKTVAPVYAPAIITGTVSVACILGSYKIGTKRTAALATAYEFTQSRLIEYQDKVKETIGEKKEQKIRDEIAQDKLNNSDHTEVIMGDGLTLFYDPCGGRYFKSSIDIIRKAEKYVSDRLPVEHYVSMNDFYSEIGLPATMFGDQMAFTVDNGIEVTFSSCVAPDDTPCMVMDFFSRPVPDYRY